MNTDSIHSYMHPYVAVDGAVLRYHNGAEVLLTKRQSAPQKGAWSLPGGFLDIDKRIDHTLLEKVEKKTGVSGYYMEQLKTYDTLDRDSRGRILSVAYLALIHNNTAAGNWFRIDGETLIGKEETIRFDDLAFDHGVILRDALDRLSNKLWYSDLPRYLLPEQFTVREAQQMFEEFGQQKRTSFRRYLGARVVETGDIRTYGAEGGRPAALLRWNNEWKGD